MTITITAQNGTIARREAEAQAGRKVHIKQVFFHPTRAGYSRFVFSTLLESR